MQLRAALALLLAVPGLVVAAPSPPVTATDGCSAGTMTITDVVGYDHVEAVQGEVAGAYTGGRNLTRVVFAASESADASCTLTVPDGVTELRTLVVGGGGGGGGGYGGGGGGGGVYYRNEVAVSPGASVTAVVGRGGAGGVPCGPSACEPDSPGQQGRASSLHIDGVLVANAGGGGGGGQSGGYAPAMASGDFTATGGGGGGGSMGIGTPHVASGAIPPDANSSFAPWWGSSNGDLTQKGGLGGGTGGPGGDSRSTEANNMVTGGGGGAMGEEPPQSGDPSRPHEAVGAYGVVTNVEGDTTIRYGAGGGGVEARSDSAARSTFTSMSPTSGGSGGTPTSRPGGDGVDGTGGGGGGAHDSEGGDGGSGTVTIWFYRAVDLSGPTTVSTTFGTAATSAAFTASGGQFEHEPSATWVLDDGSGGSVTGIGFDTATRKVTVDASTPAGTHSMRLTVTDVVGMSDTVAITVTVEKAAQAPISFSPGPPAVGRISGDDYVTSLIGGSGSGAHAPSIDPSSSLVCSGVVEGSTITITFLAVGTCVLLGDRAGDDDHRDATQISESIVVAEKEAQSVLHFGDVWPVTADEGDSGFTFTVSGGSGTGAYSVTVDPGSTSVCSVAGSGPTYSMTHIGPGSCLVNLDRAGDNDHHDATTEQAFYWVRGLRTLTIDPATFRHTYPWAGSDYDIAGLALLVASTGSAPMGSWYVRDSAGVCTANGVPVIRIIGEGVCTVYATESDPFSWVESTTPAVTFRVIDRLVPEFRAPTPAADGFTTLIENIHPDWTWTATTDAGSVMIDPAVGTVQVSGLTPGQTATVTVTSSHADYADGTATVTGVALAAGLIPQFDTPIAGEGGLTVDITNFDPAWTWSVSSSSGTASIDGAGRVIVSGLALSQSVTITVDTRRSGYLDGSASLSGSASATTTTTTTTTSTTTTTVPTAASTAQVGVRSGSPMTALAAPVRFLDTRRTGERVGELDGTGAPIRFQVAGLDGVPSTGVSAVAANVTVVASEAADVGGYLTVYPCGSVPDTSTLNFGSGATVANAVIAPLSASGEVCIHVYGTAHVLFDVSGWFGSGFSALGAPVRLLDTRSSGRVGALDGSAEPVVLRVAGVRGVPVSGVSAVAMNVTVVDPVTNDFGGFVTVFPCGGRPDASNLNFVSGQVVANAVVAPVSSDGTVCFHVYGSGHLLADVSGWFDE